MDDCSADEAMDVCIESPETRRISEKPLPVDRPSGSFHSGAVPLNPWLSYNQEFHQISDQTLDDLTEVLERLVESDHPEVTGWDVDYSRFDYDKRRKSWFYSREGNELIGLMSSEIDSILGANFFSKLLQSSNLSQQ
ncbi:hypothetical protein PtA15_13A75 [Puccinia triticina]|uniref:Uncharacterized protein n=1 Tax=Puccinia triticina TaxID=208348 RepID=A0ABY7CZR1_9BASI|nr:uncharacterized protein PtA15_13A75 [Puccinia triticina]WAQ90676.1 hypothetical protein PtA15_13A75 [Puccinia triticina]WAR60831.1 hypothetical protein PtB15_13B77 [Puccinia triticina]